MNFNSEVNFGDLIKVLGGGLKVSTYPQIVEMLKTRYQEVYGSDIDINPATADGIWIHDIALLINNILQGMQTLYANQNVNTASGEFLDNLCRLSNVTRKGATSSIASVTIQNVGNATATLNGITCIDKNGLEWTSNETITLVAGASRQVNVSCVQAGEIEAPAHSIYQVINTPSNILLSCTQNTKAVVGTNTETDAELRARRNSSNSPIGMTTIDSLVGALLEIAGIQDCVIVENKTQSSSTTYKGYDGTSIAPHSVYVVLKTQGAYNEDNVADTIYQKLTAGIGTMRSGHDNGGTWEDGTGGTDKSKQYYPQIYGIDNSMFDTTIYWKETTKDTALHPAITIELNENQYFSEDNIPAIAKGLMEYINSLPINTDLVDTDLEMKVLELDPQFKGIPTFSVSALAITGAVSGVYSNPLTFYNYTIASSYNPSTHTFGIY